MQSNRTDDARNECAYVLCASRATRQTVQDSLRRRNDNHKQTDWYTNTAGHRIPFHSHTHTLMPIESYSASPGAGQRERTHGKPFLASVQDASRWIGWNLLHFNGHYRLHCSASTFNSYDCLAEQMRAEHYILLSLMWCRVLFSPEELCVFTQMSVESCAVDVHLRIFSL